MPTIVKDIIAIMEEHFPPWLAEAWDNSGLQLGSANKVVEKVAVALDLDKSILDQALKLKIGLIITHHPLFFRPLKHINYDSPVGSLIQRMVKSGISVYTAHTNLDAAEKGINQVLAELLGLQDIDTLETSKREELYKLVVYVPASHSEELRRAINGAGAGFIGNYSDCSFRVRGTGTFRPGAGSQPFLGQEGELEEADEFRLETVVRKQELSQVLQAMEEAHPYEEVAFDLFRLEQAGKRYSMGRSGLLPEETKLGDYARQVKETLGLEAVRVVGDLDKVLRKVAIVSGAGASLIPAISQQGIELLVTGDLKYHEARDAEASGLAIIDAGHQGTEEIISAHLSQFLQQECEKRGMKLEFIPLYSEACFKYL
ncbi:MAG: Nif3-like dinuclear metal center hexameric protein [Syntrophomonas sp.]|uniref:Nif3-like dinuclear metal center hexameric protein n=1 Tax=Syntrophomonas sp. TaxID=2053627 RepID=UPI00261A723F|nr:Nif3-like dinuclear metal center hexameric protein [Syntrophomonas sp.]MDD4627173.1 Nif3-like dinuclear metal center hexameric protein [Syntrophomonas sp.]